MRAEIRNQESFMPIKPVLLNGIGSGTREVVTNAYWRALTSVLSTMAVTKIQFMSRRALIQAGDTGLSLEAST